MKSVSHWQKMIWARELTRLATPMDCLVMTRPEPMVTVSVYSVPEKEPEPYETDYQNKSGENQEASDD